MGEVWYVRIGGDTVGPRTRDELENMRAVGSIEPSTPVWREGTPDWGIYGDSGLASPKPPPFPTTTVQPDTAWQASPLMSMEAPAMGAATAGAPAIPLAWREPMDRRAYVPTRPVFDHGFDPAVPGMPKLAVGDDGWQVTTPAPWRRYFGRMFDLTLLGTMVWFSIGLIVGHLSPALHDRLFASGSVADNLIVSTVLTCIVVTPVLALLIGLTGSSPGKWIFGTRITTPDGRPIGIGKAFVREMEVLVWGLGLGIPVISLFTLIACHSKLTSDDVARWDERKGWVVTHRQQGALQVVMCLGGVALWLAGQFALRVLASQ